MSKPLNWVPRRRGNIYCSPACGYNCTFQHYQQAKKSGGALAHRLGSGWHAEVWENLGWHFAVVSPDRNIRVRGTISEGFYIAWLAGDCEHGTSPEQAILAVIKTMSDKIHRGSGVLSQTQSVYEEMKVRVGTS